MPERRPQGWSDARCPAGRRLSVGFISLGCPKNQVDCELMLAGASRSGYEITPRLEDADAIVVNTCCFIAEAQAEADREIQSARRYRERGRCRALVVTGCLPQYLQEQAAQTYPFVDAWLGPDGIMRIGEVLDGLLGAAGSGLAEHPASARIPAPSFLPTAEMPRTLSTPPSLAYIKIADGCDHRCRFCIIPQLRGRHRSREIADIVQEASALAARGIPELVLISQDSSAYGTDRGRRELPELLEALCRIEGEFQLRVMYLHPEGIDAHLLATWAALGPRLLPYFDIPLQHVSPRILKSMGRGGGRAEIDALLERIRRACPAAVLRTSLIAGYPGEEEADFRELLDWVEAGAVEHLGVFAYSDLPEAASHRLSGHLPEELKEQRREELYRAHEPHIARRNAAMLGRRAEVLIDALRSVRGRMRQYEGRVWWQAYGIDGVVHVAAEHRLKPGARLAVRISGAGGCDLHAEPEAGSGQF